MECKLSKLAGLSQHRRRQPYEVYNNEIVTDRKKPRWSEEEEHLLAMREAPLIIDGVYSINQCLHTHFPGRSLESIKCHRKAKSYRALVAMYVSLESEHRKGLGIVSSGSTSGNAASHSLDAVHGSGFSGFGSGVCGVRRGQSFARSRSVVAASGGALASRSDIEGAALGADADVGSKVVGPKHGQSHTGSRVRVVAAGGAVDF